MRQVAIYALCEFPDLAAVRYVGQSIEPVRRLYNHIAPRHERNHRRNWINAVLASGGAIGCVVIEWVQPEQADAAERYWIGELRRRGYNLTNGRAIYGPVPDYQTSTEFEPVASKVLLTLPYRNGREWHEGEIARLGRAAMKDGAAMRAELDRLFWHGIDALLTGKVTMQYMNELAALGSQAERQR